LPLEIGETFLIFSHSGQATIVVTVRDEADQKRLIGLRRDLRVSFKKKNRQDDSQINNLFREPCGSLFFYGKMIARFRVKFGASSLDSMSEILTESSDSPPSGHAQDRGCLILSAFFLIFLLAKLVSYLFTDSSPYFLTMFSVGVLGIALYFGRQKQRNMFGLMEIILGICTAGYAVYSKSDGSSSFSEFFPKSNIQLCVKVSSSIFTVMKGVENLLQKPQRLTLPERLAKLQFDEAFANVDLPTIETYLRAGLSVYEITDSRVPLFADMVRKNKTSIVALLLKYGADPNYMWNGKTILYHAAVLGHLDIVKILLKAGANPNKGYTVARPDRFYNPNPTLPQYVTPLEGARERGFQDIVALLEKVHNLQPKLRNKTAPQGGAS